MKADDSMLGAFARALAKNPHATTTELAGAARISRATLNRYFPSRSALVRATLAHALRMTREIVVTTQPLHEIVERLCEIGPQVTVLMRHEFALEADRKVKRQADEVLAQLTVRVKAARGRGKLRRDLPLSWQVRVLADLIWSGWSAVEGGEIGAKECGPLVWRTWMEGQDPLRES